MVHVEISLIWNRKIIFSNKISLKICGIAQIFHITCYWKNEDKNTSEPVISDGSVCIKIMI